MRADRSIPSPVRASLGENSCSQKASGSCCTADPTPRPCHSGSHPLKGPGAPCCGRAWTFYDTGPVTFVPCFTKRMRGNGGECEGQSSWHPIGAALHMPILWEITMTLDRDTFH